MKVKEFLHADCAIVLPNAVNPKVYLAIGTSRTARLSFSLYNPFSLKGKLFKGFAQFFCIYLNGLVKIMAPTESKTTSPFIEYLQEELDVTFVSSVYLATAKDKVVLQLIEDNRIFGYVKFPISIIGNRRLENEKFAITKLCSYEITPNFIHAGKFKETQFIVLSNIEGSIGDISRKEYLPILKSFEKSEKKPLKTHPRILLLLEKLKEYDLKEYHQHLQNLIVASNRSYKIVYEHGDFAPWNIIRTSNGFIPFDFEYFVELGLEFLDEIKFNFQREHLLNGKNGIVLIQSISKKINIPEFDIIFQIFLLKEIVVKKEDDQNYDLEKELLRKFK